MLLAASLVLHRVFTFDGSTTYRRNAAFGLLATLIPISVYHCVKKETILYVLDFVGMVVVVGTKTRKLVLLRIKERDRRRRVGGLERFGVCKCFNLLISHCYDTFIFIWCLMEQWQFINIAWKIEWRKSLVSDIWKQTYLSCWYLPKLVPHFLTCSGTLISTSALSLSHSNVTSGCPSACC